MVLGFNQVTWDNDSKQESKPQSFNKFWIELTQTEREAAVLLDFNERSWDNDSGNEPQPVSLRKKWADLTACPKGDDARMLASFGFPFSER